MRQWNDAELLSAYADRQSEEAFGVLVERYIALVYSAALRQVRNPPLAEEVTQAAFVILAQKARRLDGRTVLAGWLCRTAHYVARNALKAELRRQSREKEAHMQSLVNEPEAEVWRPLAPLLDEAVAQLNDADRNAVVLRFYERKPLNEVGDILGVDPDVAQKRVSRALEKLRKFFARRGVDSTAAAIGETISANSVHAAPAALAKTVTAVALAKGATASASTLTLIKGALKIMAWTKAKTTVIAGVAVILATGTGVVVIRGVHHKPQPVHLAAGALPQTLEELNAWYAEPPPGQNAATFNLQGFKALQTKGADRNANLPILGKLPPPFPFTPLPLPEKSALADFVQRNRGALQFFAQGAQHEQSRYPLDFNQGQKLQFPHLQEIKTGTQVAEMAAILDAENNDGKQAADDVLLTVALARSLNAEPMLISQLVREASGALALAALEQAMNRTALPPESLNELSQAFREMEEYAAQGEGLNRSLIGEKVMVIAALKTANVQDLPGDAAQDATDEQRQRLAQLLKQPGGLKAEQDFLSTTFDQFLAAGNEDFPGRLNNAAAVQQRATETTNDALLLNNGWLTGYAKLVSKEATDLANFRLGMTAVALEQFRATHNQYPATLSELAPMYLDATPMDPFDGQPLRYRKQGAGYLLYSIGPDLKDDGGKRMTAKGGDLVFTVVTPPAI